MIREVPLCYMYLQSIICLMSPNMCALLLGRTEILAISGMIVFLLLNLVRVC